MKSKLVYIIDPYCIWCYGNELIINHVYETYHHRLDFKILPVGMWSENNRRNATPELARMLKYQARKVSDITEVVFGNNFFNLINDTSRIFDSEIPAMANIGVICRWRFVICCCEHSTMKGKIYLISRFMNNCPGVLNYLPKNFYIISILMR